MRAGDLFGFCHRSLSSGLICLATYGIPLLSLSHVGILADTPQGLRLFEANDEGVDHFDPHQRIAGYDGRVWHYPLYRDLYDHEATRLEAFLTSMLGRPYDTRGAIRSGGKLFSSVEALLRPPDLTNLFCSELVASAHAAIGLFATSNPSAWSPNALTRTERRQGILMNPRRLR